MKRFINFIKNVIPHILLCFIKDLELAPRRTARVYALAESAKKTGDAESMQSLYMALIVSDCAKSAIRFSKPKTWLYIFITPRYITEKFDIIKFTELYTKCAELENIKKKVPETESQSDEQSPGT